MNDNTRILFQLHRVLSDTAFCCSFYYCIRRAIKSDIYRKLFSYINSISIMCTIFFLSCRRIIFTHTHTLSPRFTNTTRGRTRNTSDQIYLFMFDKKISHSFRRFFFSVHPYMNNQIFCRPTYFGK